MVTGETTSVFLNPQDLSETTVRQYRIPLTRVCYWKSEIANDQSRIYQKLLLLNPDFATDENFNAIAISEMSWRWKGGDSAYMSLVSRKEESWLEWISHNEEMASSVWLTAISELREQPNEQRLDIITNDLVEIRFRQPHAIDGAGGVE